jgi:hypothetical protein
MLVFSGGLQLQLQSGGDIDADSLMSIISSALNMDPSTDDARLLWEGFFKHLQDKLKLYLTSADKETVPSKRETSTTVKEASIPFRSLARLGSFLLTFGAISEVCTAEETSNMISFAIGLLSFTAIIGLFVLELKFALH